MSGRRSRPLTTDMIRRLKEFQRAKRYSVPELNSTMAGNFTWSTLQRALDGKPIWELSYEFIEAWLDKFVPANGSVHHEHDFKRAAANDDEDEPNGNADAPVHQRLRSEP